MTCLFMFRPKRGKITYMIRIFFRWIETNHQLLSQFKGNIYESSGEIIATFHRRLVTSNGGLARGPGNLSKMPMAIHGP